MRLVGRRRIVGRGVLLGVLVLLSPGLPAQKAPRQDLDIDIRPRMTAQGHVEVRFEMVDLALPFELLSNVRTRRTGSETFTTSTAKLLELDPSDVQVIRSKVEAEGGTASASPPPDVQFTLAPPTAPASATEVEKDCECREPDDPVICLFGGRKVEFANPCKARCAGATDCKIGSTQEIKVPEEEIKDDCACNVPDDPVICLYRGRSIRFANPCKARCSGAVECKTAGTDVVKVPEEEDKEEARREESVKVPEEGRARPTPGRLPRFDPGEAAEAEEDENIKQPPRTPMPGFEVTAPNPAEVEGLPPVLFHVYRVDDNENVVHLTREAPVYPIPVRDGDRRLILGAVTDPTAERYRAYRYWVRAEDPRGTLLGSASSDVFVPHDGRPPGPVRGLRADPAAASVTLEWTAPLAPGTRPRDGVPDGEVTSYRLYREDHRGLRDPRSQPRTRRAAEPPERPQGPASHWLVGDASGLTRTGVGDVRLLDVSEHGVLVATLKAGVTSFVDRSPEPGVTYTYRITAVDPYSGEGDASPPVAARLLDVTAPLAPRQFGARALADGVVAMEWRTSPSPDVVRYRVDRQIVGGADWVPVMSIAPGAETSMVAQDHLDPRSQYTYRYRVAAVDAAGNDSEPAAAVTLRLPDIVAPRPPAITELTPGDAVVRLAWSAPIDDDVAGYRVHRERVDREEEVAALTPQGTASRFFDDRTGVIGAVYAYWVTAVDGDGNESEPSRRYEQKVIGTLRPEAPADVRVRTAPDGRPEVTWTAQSGSVDIRYVVFRAPGPDGTWTPVSGALREPRFVDESPDGSAWYRVVARYHTGQLSPPSPGAAWLRAARREGGGG